MTRLAKIGKVVIMTGTCWTISIPVARDDVTSGGDTRSNPIATYTQIYDR